MADVKMLLVTVGPKPVINPLSFCVFPQLYNNNDANGLIMSYYSLLMMCFNPASPGATRY